MEHITFQMEQFGKEVGKEIKGMVKEYLLMREEKLVITN